MRDGLHQFGGRLVRGGNVLCSIDGTRSAGVDGSKGIEGLTDVERLPDVDGMSGVECLLDVDGMTDVERLPDVDGPAMPDMFSSAMPDIRSSVKAPGLLLNDSNSAGLECESVCAGFGTSNGYSSSMFISFGFSGRPLCHIIE